MDRISAPVSAWLSAAVLAVALIGQALAEGTPEPARQASRHYHQATLDERVSALAKALDLNPAQRTQVRQILQSQRQQTFALLHDPSVPPENRIGALRAANDRTVEQIRALLNEEQRTKYYPSGTKAAPGTSEESEANLHYWLNAGSGIAK